MHRLVFNQDEFSINKEQIEFTEKVLEKEFPQDYRFFLQQYNGAEVFPNTPSLNFISNSDTIWCFPIERFCSIGDIVLQKKYQMEYTWTKYLEDEVKQYFEIEVDDLITIAVAERGCYYMNLNKNQFGQIYYANYLGENGIAKLETSSFDDFLKHLKPFEGDYGFEKSRKIYDIRYFDTPSNPALGLKRFDEVLTKFGNANSKSRESGWTVIQYYAYYNQYNIMGKHIFNHLFKPDINMDGILNRSIDFDVISKIVLEYGQDYNMPYNGSYPIHWITSGTMAKIKEDYELLDKLLKSDIKIDFTIKDANGKNVIDRIRLMHNTYNKYIERERQRWKTRPEMLNQFIISDEINKLVD
ncbi:SMI1/KNR4 family protein [Chondrinema litorale]|uniref:SMI1/KNR4 family protein n=1 Tax=Chondrinema litorale TaxID=2994555 RepID=UPI002542CCDC|nr:SMI1/KNR4 family protein [Chondrinema litorale]UZR96778.1 SMI1/KNR4 family protein [Chondrinema litorale]